MEGMMLKLRNFSSVI